MQAGGHGNGSGWKWRQSNLNVVNETTTLRIVKTFSPLQLHMLAAKKWCSVVATFHKAIRLQKLKFTWFRIWIGLGKCRMSHTIKDVKLSDNHSSEILLPSSIWCCEKLSIPNTLWLAWGIITLATDISMSPNYDEDRVTFSVQLFTFWLELVL